MSESIEKLNAAFLEGLGLPQGTQVTTLEYSKHDNWDSVAHMQLIAALESKFDIMMETDDVIDLSSYQKSKEILGKYGISFHD